MDWQGRKNYASSPMSLGSIVHAMTSSSKQKQIE
jgi:hypothetical protein